MNKEAGRLTKTYLIKTGGHIMCRKIRGLDFEVKVYRLVVDYWWDRECEHDLFYIIDFMTLTYEDYIIILTHLLALTLQMCSALQFLDPVGTRLWTEPSSVSF